RLFVSAQWMNGVVLVPTPGNLKEAEAHQLTIEERDTWIGKGGTIRRLISDGSSLCESEKTKEGQRKRRPSLPIDSLPNLVRIRAAHRVSCRTELGTKPAW